MHCKLKNSEMLLFQVHNLVAIELAYINTKHPDFTDAAQVSASVNSQQVLKLYFFSISPNSNMISICNNLSFTGGGWGCREAMEK